MAKTSKMLWSLKDQKEKRAKRAEQSGRSYEAQNQYEYTKAENERRRSNAGDQAVERMKKNKSDNISRGLKEVQEDKVAVRKARARYDGQTMVQKGLDAISPKAKANARVLNKASANAGIQKKGILNMSQAVKATARAGIGKRKKQRILGTPSWFEKD